MQVFPQQKRHISCIGYMLDRRHVHMQYVGRDVWSQGLCGPLENIWAREDFKSGRNEQRMKKTNWRATRHYYHKGWEVEKSLSWTKLVKPEQQGESKIIWCIEMALTRLMKVEKQVETKMIWCLEMALYQTHESWEVGKN